jgi:hypothetical protein
MDSKLADRTTKSLEFGMKVGGEGILEWLAQVHQS